MASLYYVLAMHLYLLVTIFASSASSASSIPTTSCLSGVSRDHNRTPKSNDGGVIDKDVTASFCTVRADGCYRHPSNCSRILQCFDSELFEDDPCTHSLAYNEATASCDYPERIEGCEPVRQSSINCKARKEGEQVGGKCSRLFYRCIGGKAMSLQCSFGLIFSVKTGICDLPSEVECEQLQSITKSPHRHPDYNDHD